MSMTKAKDGPLQGHNMMDISGQRIEEIAGLMIAASVRYGLGAKPKILMADDIPPLINQHGEPVNQIDCSGFAREAIYYASHGQNTIPDGSFIQADWFRKNDFKPSTFLNMGLADGIVRIAFHRPDHRDNIGHVWITYGDPNKDRAARSFESHGGTGPAVRPWNSNILKFLFTECYCVGYASKSALAEK